jgi:hypothetical protein
MVVDVPARGVATPYVALGDALVYACAAGLAALIGLAAVRGRRSAQPAPLAALAPQGQD